MWNTDLCARCGTCVGAGAGTMHIGPAQFPESRRPDEIPSLCGRCCPGASVSYEELTRITFGDLPDDDSFDGRVQQTLIGYCTDERMRGGGAGGGLITALLWDQLKHGEVDGCIVTRMNPAQPWLGEPFIATTYEELLSSQGSKYTTIPLNAVLHDVKQRGGTYAYAGLPCQVHGLRLLMDHDPQIRNQIRSVTGLFCGGALEPYFVLEMLQTKGIQRDEIRNFEFRGGEWPGKMRAVLKNGKTVNLHYSNYKDGAYNYFNSIYMPVRCQTCIDGSGQFSDVSVSDAWTRDEMGRYKFKNQSRMLVRTEMGRRLVQRAAERGTICVEDVTKDASYKTHRIQTKRKGMMAPLRVERWKQKNRAVPAYDRPVPKASVREKFDEQAVTSLLQIGRYKWLRYPLMKLLTSVWAVPLIWLRQWRKKRKYARRRKASKS